MMIRKILLIVTLLIFIENVYSQKPFYCQAPLPVPTDNTEGLTLKMVQVVTRHGDRTPLYTTLNGLMNDWNCTLSTYMLPSMNNGGNNPINDVDLLFRKVYMPNREELPGNCSIGQLTAIGFQQHINLGNAFRSIYIDKYQLLSEELDETEIYVRSTDVPRTLQSAQGHITGLYPGINTSPNGPNTGVLNIHTMDDYFDNMEPNNDLCPILNQYYYNLTSSSEYHQFNYDNYDLKKQIEKILEITQAPDWSSLMDLFFATQCHSLPLPVGITQEIVDATYNASFWENKFLLSPPIVARLSMSTFLEEIVENIQGFIDGNVTTKYFIFSGHDDTIGPLMNLFGLYSFWPPYASHVEFELWENESNGDQFIQVNYNGVTQQIPGCDSLMCQIDQFIETAYTILVPDYTDACQPTSSSSSWN